MVVLVRAEVKGRKLPRPSWFLECRFSFLAQSDADIWLK
jgi:hypothetical protein